MSRERLHRNVPRLFLVNYWCPNVSDAAFVSFDAAKCVVASVVVVASLQMHQALLELLPRDDLIL